jgi:hypothetical protein
MCGEERASKMREKKIVLNHSPRLVGLSQILHVFCPVDEIPGRSFALANSSLTAHRCDML